MTLANLVRYAAVTTHRLAGHNTRNLESRRSGINWKLDLNEGIDLSIYLFGGFEVRTVRALLKYLSGDYVVIDVGANIGAYALPFAKNGTEASRVYAIEPTTWAFQKLLENINLNPEIKSRVKAFKVGFLPESLDAPQQLSASWNLADLGKNENIDGATYKTTDGCQFLSLDNFIRQENINRVDLIKVDVDGRDLEVLQSGWSTIDTYKPVIMVEFAPYLLERNKRSVEEFFDLFGSLDYCLQTIAGRPVSLESKRFLANIPKHGGCNLIAKPSEKE